MQVNFTDKNEKGLNEMVKLGVNGACGRMGLRIMSLATDDNNITLSQAIESDNNPNLGKDVGVLLNTDDIGVKVSNKLDPDNIDVLIDFSAPVVTVERAKECGENGIGIVIGTTGLSEEQKEELIKASKKTACLLAPNMSVGVNLLFDIVSQVTKAIGDECEIEVIETHHKFKKDAPSGTALKIVEKICDSSERTMDNDVIYGRCGQTGERKKNQIGVHAVRLRDTIGVHKVIFDGRDECIEITHDAHSRDAFASGAITAAKFIANSKPGFYSMSDVLKRE